MKIIDKLTESEILACRKYRDIIAKKSYTTADINFLYLINRDFRDLDLQRK